MGLGIHGNINKPTLLMRDKEIRQIICGSHHTLILKESGELFAFGDNTFGELGLGDYKNRSTPTLLMTDKGIRQIICGRHHTFILKNNGELFTFGKNINGELGLGDSDIRNVPTLLMINENIKIINNTIIEKIIWIPSIFFTLSETKKMEIKNFFIDLSLL